MTRHKDIFEGRVKTEWMEYLRKIHRLDLG